MVSLSIALIRKVTLSMFSVFVFVDDDFEDENSFETPAKNPEKVDFCFSLELLFSSSKKSQR